MGQVEWIKLSADLFGHPKIRLILSREDGDQTVLFWIRLLTLAAEANEDGALYLTEGRPFTARTLAALCGKPRGFVTRALRLFGEYGMLDEDDGAYRIRNWAKYQSADALERIREQTRERVARHRQERRACNVTVTQCNAPKENQNQKEKKNQKETKKQRENAASAAAAPGAEARSAQEAPPTGGKGPKVTVRDPDPVAQVVRSAVPQPEEPSGSLEIRPESFEPLPPDVFTALPLLGGKRCLVSQKDVDHFRDFFPSLDVEQQFRSMSAWLEANPRQRKTAQGIRRFITNWLEREQNHAPRAAPGPQGSRVVNVFDEMLKAGVT